jgi:hypothetical protein
MPLTPLKEMSAALNPVISVLKDKVNAVVVCEKEPLAVTLEKVTGVVVVLTVTEQVAVLLPSAVVTVIVALPADMAVTIPPETVAMVLLLLLHVTFWLVALEGLMVAVKVSVPPTVRLIDDLLKDTLVTDITELLTVTAQDAFLPPSSVVTVITAFPSALPVITPFVTVATASLLLSHVTFWLVALEGVKMVVSVSIPPTVSVVLVLFKDTFVTATSLALTVTAQESFFPPSTVVTVMTATPAALPVITPFVTDAMVESSLFHLKDLFVALAGVMIAVSVSALPTVSVVLVLLRDTLVTATEVSSGFSPWISVGSMSQPVSITDKIIAEK